MSSQTVERLRHVGLKATGPRIMLLAALEEDRSHPTAEQLYETLRAHYPSLSLSTVYQTLDVFIRTGLCRRVSDAGNRLRVDGTPHDHDHAICHACNTIFDVDQQFFPRSTPPAQLPQGLTVTGLRVAYDVICADCRAQLTEAGANSPANAYHVGTSRGNTDRRKKRSV
jgi:Fur family peroxide stress response transcriptional regulator